MTRPDDTEDVLHDFISGDDDDRLLAGQADIQDEELAPLASLFVALREPARVNEAEGTKVLVAQMARAVREGGSLTTQAKRKPMMAQLLTGKVAAVAVLSLFSASAAAAATGNLPDPLQRDVSEVLSRVGVNVPTPDSSPDTSSTSSSGDSNTSTAKGPDATGAAQQGLCTAYLADKAKNPKAVAFKNLTKAANGAGMTVDEYCAAAPEDGSATTQVQTKPVPPGNSGATPAVTAPGQSGSTPGATAPGQSSTPGQSGSTPGATAPGQGSTPGSSGSTPGATAPGQSSVPGSSGSTPGATAPGQVSNPGSSGSTPGATAPGQVSNPGSSGSTPGATAPGQQSIPKSSGPTPGATAPGKQPIPGNSGSTPGATAPGQSDNPGNGQGKGAAKSSTSAVSVPATPQATRPSASTPPTSEHGKP
jgi:hypothetical protein